jgi:hypothetical protein
VSGSQRDATYISCAISFRECISSNPYSAVAPEDACVSGRTKAPLPSLCWRVGLSLTLTLALSLSPIHHRLLRRSATEVEVWGGALTRYVVVFGGWDTEPVRRYNDVHVLDTVTWTWHAAAVAGDAPSARCGHTACAVRVDGGKHAVLVLHGQEEDERLCADAHLLMLE